MSDESGLPHVSIIILNYNGMKSVGQCLTSVLSTNYPSFDIIFVDNSSTDGSLDYVRKTFTDPRLKIVCNSKNLGCAGGFNAGACLSRGKYIVFLSNDTRVDTDWLKELIKVAESNSRVGIVHSKLLQMDNPELLSAAGLLIIPFAGWTVRRGGDTRDDGRYNFQRPIIANSTCMMMKRSVLNKIDYFDKETFLYFEDIDLSLRAWLSGYDVVFVPKSIVYHKHKRTELTSIHHFHLNKNCFRMLIKNYSTLSLLKYLPTAIILSFLSSCYFLIKKRLPYPMLGFFKAIMWNLQYLPSTLNCRRLIQKWRKMPDSEIWKRVAFKASPYYIYKKYYTG